MYTKSSASVESDISQLSNVRAQLIALLLQIETSPQPDALHSKVDAIFAQMPDVLTSETKSGMLSGSTICEESIPHITDPVFIAAYRDCEALVRICHSEINEHTRRSSIKLTYDNATYEYVEPGLYKSPYYYLVISGGFAYLAGGSTQPDIHDNMPKICLKCVVPAGTDTRDIKNYKTPITVGNQVQTCC